MNREKIEQLKANNDIVEVVGRYTPLRQTGRVFRGEQHDSLIVCPDRQAFWWNSRGDDWCGDVVAWMKVYHDVGFNEAVRLLGGELFTPNRTTKQVATKPTPKPTNPPPSEWQQPVLEVVKQCADTLFSPAGERARRWLNERGLVDDTLRFFGVGFNPSERRHKGHFVWQGVTIPTINNGALWGVKVRLGEQSRKWIKAKGDDPPKYISIKGGVAKSWLNLDSVGNAEAVLLVEGEFDAMLGHQLVGDLLPVVSYGGDPPPILPPQLLRVKRILCSFDHDEAGEGKAASWLTAHPRRVEVCPVPNPTGEPKFDLTDYHTKSGGNLRQWMGGLLSPPQPVTVSAAERRAARLIELARRLAAA